MNGGQVSQQVGAAAGAAPSPPPSGPLPDLNLETYPVEFVQQLLDQAASFNLFLTPDLKTPNTPIFVPGTSQLAGVRVSGELHAFNCELLPPSLQRGILVSNTQGQRAGSLKMRFMLIPEDFEAGPGREPPPVAEDASISQRCVLQDAEFRFGDGSDGFYGFAAGRTYPLMVAGEKQLHVAALGNITAGFGKFAGLEGNYLIAGVTWPDYSFDTQIFCLVPDPSGKLQIAEHPPVQVTGPTPDPDLTFILFKGTKDVRYPTTFGFQPDGQIEGLNVVQRLREARFSFTVDGPRGLRANTEIGRLIGSEAGEIHFNPLAPGAPGTAAAPIPFTSPNELYTFVDGEGRVVGSFRANLVEARTFNTTLPGAPGLTTLRFGGFGPIYDATGPFSGIEALLYFVAVGTIQPHVLSSFYVLGAIDPEGKLRV